MSDRRDGVEEELQASLRAGAPRPPIHLLDHVLRLTEPLPQRSAGWRQRSSRLLALGGAAVILVAAFGAGTGLPERLGLVPAASVSPAPTAQPSGRALVTAPPSAASVAPSAAPTASPAAMPTPLPTPSVYARWERIDLPDPAPDVYGGGLPDDVVAFKGAYVAIGTINGSCCADGDPSLNRGVVWISRDGRQWELLSTIGAFAHASVRRLLTDGSRLLAYGAYAEPVPEGNAESVPAVWVSTDARGWTRQRGPVPALVAYSEGRFLGVGSRARQSDGLIEEGVLLTSKDGIEWHETANVFPAAPQDLAVGPTGAIIVGWRTRNTSDGLETEAVASTSDDGGQHWSEPRVIGPGLVESVVASGEGYMAVGTDRSGGVIWSSEDGIDWQSLRPIGREDLLYQRVLAVPGRVIVAGVMPQPEILGAVVLVSAGGDDWSEVQSEALLARDSALTRLLRTPSGILAVGRGWDESRMHPIPVAWLAVR